MWKLWLGAGGVALAGGTLAISAKSLYLRPNPAGSWRLAWGAGADREKKILPLVSIGRSGFLTYRDRGQYLTPRAAWSFLRMAAAARRDGIDLPDQLVTSFRTWKHQKSLHDRGITTAPAGTSNHQRGTAVDINTLAPDGPPTQAWLEANASRYGWRRTYSNRAHWEYFG